MSPNDPTLSVPHMITADLGYCCPWLFFKLYGRSSVIAARLGVSQRTVNRYRAKVKAGELGCLSCPKCQKANLQYLKENLPKP